MRKECIPSSPQEAPQIACMASRSIGKLFLEMVACLCFFMPSWHVNLLQVPGGSFWNTQNITFIQQDDACLVPVAAAVSLLLAVELILLCYSYLF